jgi:D-arabinose 1-dehydrogenase-like Zn-dependent alcohol dehydrogenase
VQMIGKHRDGGYADFVRVPGRNAFLLPDEIPFEVGAIMMCSSATALHALNKARLRSAESLAIFGFGGLGFSALQLAKARGGGEVFVIDINPAKLALAKALGVIAIDATAGDPVVQIEEATSGKGVDVSVELVGSATTMTQAVKCLGVRGRAALIALTTQSLSLFPYPDLINKEAEVVGISDHLASELPLLIELVRSGKLKFPQGTISLVNLKAAEINPVLDAIEKSAKHIRTVIVPKS